MEVRVLGAGRDVGRSCLLLTACSHRILLDCGAHHGFDDSRRFPAFDALPPEILSSVDAVLISHFHFDHIGALPLLSAGHRCRAPVYMTAPTQDLGRLVLLDTVTTSRARSQYCPFSELDVHATIDAVTLIQVGRRWTLPKNSGVHVTAFPAGHCVGAVMFLLSFPDQSSVLYSGDYSLRSDRHVPTAVVPFGLAPTLFITEATYCNAVRSPFRVEQEKQLASSVIDTLSNGGKILFPVPALGRIQAIVALLSSSRSLSVLESVPMYVTAGLSTRGNAIYESLSGWIREATFCVHCSRECVPGKTNKRKRSRFADSCPHNIMSKLRPFNRNDHWNSVVLTPGPVILFATPASLSTGLSRDVFQAWSSDSNNLVVVPSSKFSTTVAADSAEKSDHISVENFSTHTASSVSCKMINLPSPSHPDCRDILRMCAHVNAENIMLVHGEQTKIVKFQVDIQNRLSTKCHAPSNGDIVNVPYKNKSQRTFDVERPLDNRLQVDDWDNLQSQYLQLMTKLRPT